MIELRHQDCMEYMRTLPDKAFDLAIVDPPYGIGAALDKRGGQQHGKAAAPSKSYGRKEWDNAAPGEEFFAELRRVTANQIIWGANHFISRLPIDSPSWVVWDKENGDNGYADCELAWSSFPSAVRQFRFRWAGMLQGNMSAKETRIHPTQKPVALYRWLLKNYAKPGQRILDTHLGSGSIAIACDIEGFDLVGCEIDADYIASARKRLAEHQAQPRLFVEEREEPQQLRAEL